MTKKILIFYTAIGQGHKSMGENIGYHLEQGGFEVHLADIGKVQSGKFEKYTVAVHQFINRNFPFVWAWLYGWGFYVVYPFRVFIARFNYKKTIAYIEQIQPDLIITVQTTASAAVAYLRQSGRYKNKWAIGFSDYHLHPFWIYKSADVFLANIQEQKDEMIKKFHIADDKIFVCGMCVKPKINVDTKAVKEKLGIQEGEKVVLVGTGSLGIGFNLADLTELVKVANTKVVFVCGKNTELYERLKKANLPHTVVLGFYTPMDELYAIADVFVTKPGGLTVAEALNWRLPMVVTFALPGQEALNYTYLLARSLILPKPRNLEQAVERELASGQFRRQLTNNSFVKLILGDGGVVVQAAQLLLQAKP